MSVVVLGMEMPRDCESCCLVENTISGISKCRETGRIWDPDPGQSLRPDWCPLRPLPKEHGRLIDADGMEKLMCDTVLGDIRRYPYNDTTWDTAFQWMDHQSTIVEAEGEE